MDSYFEETLSPSLPGYRKGKSLQDALLILVGKWKTWIDKSGLGRAIMMELSKTFDTINNSLLIAKLEAYGFDKPSLQPMPSHLSDRWQKLKVKPSY